MIADLLETAEWQCAAAPAGAVDSPRLIDALDWIDASVPGTVASALAANGRDIDPIDDQDWWFRTRFLVEQAERADLELDGLAGYADVWLNGALLVHSDNMFVPVRVGASLAPGDNVLAIRFRSLHAELGGRRPRPRWRVARLMHPQLRWARISLLGRLRGVVPTPAPVGPWRPIRLMSPEAIRLSRCQVSAVVTDAGGGRVTVRAELAGPVGPPPRVELNVPGSSVTVRVRSAGDGRWSVEGVAEFEEVELWWPHTSGAQPLVDVSLRVDDSVIPLRRVGFREVLVDQSDGGFRFVINGVDTFVGGACWSVVDPVGLQSDRDRLLPLLRLVVAGNLNMLRVSGDTIYESDAFYELCDELGILVWQDCMLAFVDPPSDESWEQTFLSEVRHNLARISGHPAVVMVSGGSEIAQQATYSGVTLDDGLPLLTDRLPVVVSEILGDVPYLPTSPWGGDIPTRPDTGVSHYYGVGAYLRTLADARAAQPRFAAECLAFAVPPARESVNRAFGGPQVAGHDPCWKRAVFRDAGASWDFEDVRDHYVRELFGVDPLQVRYVDPDRYLELGRAAVAALTAATFAEWRRGKSTSSGGLVFYLADALPGAGMGLIDAYGVPKATWYAARRVLAPVAVTVSDEGLNGLVAHLHNATGVEVDGSLMVDLWVSGELRVDGAQLPVRLPPRSSTEFGIDGLFDGFRDLSWSHRFGPVAYDVIDVTLCDPEGQVLGEWSHLPGGRSRPTEGQLGLSAEVVDLGVSAAAIVLRSSRFAQFVSVDVPGWLPDDSGFDLVPGRPRTIHLERVSATGPLSGTVSALNGGSLAVRQDIS